MALNCCFFLSGWLFSMLVLMLAAVDTEQLLYHRFGSVPTQFGTNFSEGRCYVLTLNVFLFKILSFAFQFYKYKNNNVNKTIITKQACCVHTMQFTPSDGSSVICHSNSLNTAARNYLIGGQSRDFPQKTYYLEMQNY